MKLISKIAVLSILGLGCGFGQSSCTVDQFVNNLPVADVNGTYWTIYDLTDPENRMVVEADPSCMTSSVAGGILWTAELGYWSPPPGVGDSLIMIGSWDSAYVNNPGTYGDNPNHTGFYWLYSDIVDDVALTHWEDDTLRPLPQPIAAQVGTDIELSITNPQETRYSGQTAYDVLGYWVWADTTGAGTPNCYDKEIAFVPVQGSAGEITMYSHPVSNYPDGKTVYWAYYLVARPLPPVNMDRYKSHYLSANSNPLVIIGIEETTLRLTPNALRLLEVYPNPFSNLINISFSRGQSAEGIELKIYDVSGRVVKDFILLSTYSLLPTIVCWDGCDNSGKQLSSGVYFCQIKTENIHLSKQVVLLR